MTATRSTIVGSTERLDSGLCTAENKGVNIVRALIGVDGLQVRQHTHDMELVGNTVGTVHIAREPGDLERLAAIVALHERNRGWRQPARLQQSPKSQGAGKAERNLGLHVGQLFLDQLIGGERSSELFSIEGILARSMPAELGGTHRAPSYTVAGEAEAAEGTRKA